MNDLDRLLAENDRLVPSAGFTSRVMDAVGEAAAEPPPLPFPWARFSGLVLACAAWTASAVWLAMTPGVNQLRASLGGLDATTERVRDFGVFVAIAFAAVFLMARWRHDRVPTP